MAVPSYATDLTDIYTDTDNFVTVGGGRVTAAETDDYIQGNNCWSHDPFSSGIEGGAYDAGTAPTITAGDCAYIWTKCDVAATLATHALGGIQIIMGSSATAYDCFYALGSDDYQYGGWKCIPVDPTKTPSTTIGSPTTNDHFGVRWNVPSTGASKGYPMKIDAIRYGRSATITAGDATTPATWALLAAYDATSTRQWGICQPNDAGAEIQGIVNWGTASTAAHFDDSSGSTIIIIDTEWTSTDFTKIVIDHASTIFNMDGLTIKALGTNNPGQLVYNNTSTVSTLKNNTFASIGISTLRAGVTATNNKWTLSGTVTQNSASITGCTFDKSSATTALVIDDITEVTGCTFVSDATGHAVDLGSITSTQTLTWDNILDDGTGSEWTGSSGGPTSGPSGTANDAILVAVSSGQTLTISVADGASVPTVQNTGTGNVTITAGQKTFSFTVNPSITGYEWRIYSVTAIGSLTGSTELTGQETATVDNQSYTYSYSTDTPIGVQIIDDNYVESVTYYTLVNGNQDITINLTTEENT